MALIGAGIGGGVLGCWSIQGEHGPSLAVQGAALMLIPPSSGVLQVQSATLVLAMACAVAAVLVSVVGSLTNGQEIRLVLSK